MKARVVVMLRGDVHDAHGGTLAAALVDAGFPEVTGARIGKVIDLELAGGDVAAARARVSQMCDALLANPVVEHAVATIEE